MTFRLRQILGVHRPKGLVKLNDIVESVYQLHEEWFSAHGIEE